MNFPFKFYCQKVIPLAFDESMSYYEVLCALTKYIKDTLLPAINENADAVAELQQLYIELKQYVDDYFSDLNVQTEINNKLDEMAESGELTDIIAQYLQLAGILAFNTVNDMKNAENLANGSFAKTYGNTTYNDGKGRFYKIRNVLNTDVIDEVNIIALTNFNNLIAELIPEEYLTNIGNLANLTTTNKSSLVAAINEINSGATDDLIHFSAILRPTSEGWVFIADSEHAYLNCQSVTVDSNGRLVLNHNAGASKIYSIQVGSDETFSKYNIHAGASVGVDSSLISIYQNTTAVAYMRYQNSQFTIESNYSNLVKNVEWDSANTKLLIRFDDNLRANRMTNWKAFNNNSNSYATYDYYTTYEDYNVLSVQARTRGTTTPVGLGSAYDRLFVTADYLGFINAGNLVSHPIDRC